MDSGIALRLVAAVEEGVQALRHMADAAVQQQPQRETTVFYDEVPGTTRCDFHVGELRCCLLHGHAMLRTTRHGHFVIPDSVPSETADYGVWLFNHVGWTRLTDAGRIDMSPEPTSCDGVPVSRVEVSQAVADDEDG